MVYIMNAYTNRLHLYRKLKLKRIELTDWIVNQCDIIDRCETTEHRINWCYQDLYKMVVQMHSHDITISQ